MAVIALFVLLGAMTGAWSARIPGIRAQVGLDDAQWGLLLLASPIGTLTALIVVTRLVPRTGARPLAVVGAVGVLLAIPTTSAAHDARLLGTALVVQGLSTGMLATPMNALAVVVERGYRRRIMSSFHATFSLGQLAGGGLGVFTASIGVAPVGLLAGVGLLMALALVATARWLPRDRPEPAASAAAATGAPSGAPRKRVLTPQLGLLAAVALLSSISEGSSVQWSAQYGAVTLGAGAGIGALMFTGFSVAMTTSRLFGDRLVGRLGRVRFVRWSAGLAAAGMALGLSLGSVAGGFVGFISLGLGCACLVPTVIGLAGNQQGMSAGRGVAVVSFGQWPAFLIGPPLIGAVAGLVGLRPALGITVLATMTVVLLAGRIRDPEQRTEVVASSS